MSDFSPVRIAARFAVAVMLVAFMLAAGGAGASGAPYEYRAIISYRVQPGDSFWNISHAFDVSTIQLQNDNPGVRTLTAGDVLYITTRVRHNAFPYRVSRGDTLFRISRRTGRSVASIMESSELTQTTIFPGQMLRIPAADTNEHPAWVQPGDTLARIADRYRVQVADLRTGNPLAGDHIRINQILRVQGSRGGSPPVPSRPDSPPASDPAEVVEYRVRQGDTLGAIVSRFGTTRNAVWRTNHLESELLMPGQLLYIPRGTTPVSIDGPSGTSVDGYGELLDWQLARWYYPPGTIAEVVDFYTRRQFRIRRLGGSNHADSEPLTSTDTAIMRSIFGGWTWTPRPILVKVRGRTFAASMAAMPHGVQHVHNNDFNGHFCLYFYNSRSHNTNSVQSSHQNNVLRAAGLR